VEIGLIEYISRIRRFVVDHDVLTYFAASSMVLHGATLVSGIVVLRWVPPSLMGVWQIMLLAESYALVLRMGIPNAMNRELPYLLGRGEADRGRQTAATAQLHALVCSILVFAGFTVAGVALGGGAPGWQAAAFARAVSASTNFYIVYLLGTFRSHENFKALAGIQFGQAGMVLLMPVFTYFWGYEGLCIHAALQGLALAWLAHAWRPLRVRPRFYPQAWSLLWRTGLHLFLTSYILIVVRDLEKIFLVWRGNVEVVGLFTPALAVIHSMEVIPAALSSYIYPRMSFRLGKTDDPLQLGRITFLMMGLSIALCTPLAIGGWVALPWVVHNLVPQYAPALPAMRVALFTGMFLAAVSGTTVLRALKSWKHLYGFIGLMGLSKFAMLSLLVRKDNLLMGAAWGGLVASVVTGGAAALSCALATKYFYTQRRPE
jgi:O-antigen/teichoic acid export membrane protein